MNQRVQGKAASKIVGASVLTVAVAGAGVLGIETYGTIQATQTETTSATATPQESQNTSTANSESTGSNTETGSTTQYAQLPQTSNKSSHGSSSGS